MAGSRASKILDGLILGMREVGNLFEKGDYYLPELIVSGDTVSQALKLLEPILSKDDFPEAPGSTLFITLPATLSDSNIVNRQLKSTGAV